MNTLSSPTRTRVGKTAALIGIGCNLLLFAGKLIVGLLSGALSITADAMNNLSDASGSIVALLGFALSEKPADEDHPYGHARLEYISAMMVAALILFVGFELAKSAVEKIIHPAAITFSAVTVAVLVASILIKTALAIFYHRAGKRINSPTLIATAADSRNDVITTAAVLTAIIIELLTTWRVDGYISLAVAVFILYSGVRMIKETIDPLIGKAGTSEMRDAIAAVIVRDERVIGYHDLLIHDYGPGHGFASVHVEIDHRIDALLCHEIIDAIERECFNSLHLHMVVHLDPVVTDDDTLDGLRACAAAILSRYDESLTLHDFRVAYADGNTKFIFDVAAPDKLLREQDRIRAYVQQALSERAEQPCIAVITFDPLSPS